MRKDIRLAKALSLDNSRDDRQRRVNEWGEQFKANPAHALANGSDVHQWAADLEQAIEVGAFLRGDANPNFRGDRLATAIAELELDVLTRAMRLNQSTSPSSNLMENCRRVARAKMLAFLRGDKPWL